MIVELDGNPSVYLLTFILSPIGHENFKNTMHPEPSGNFDFTSLVLISSGKLFENNFFRKYYNKILQKRLEQAEILFNACYFKKNEIRETIIQQKIRELMPEFVINIKETSIKKEKNNRGITFVCGANFEVRLKRVIHNHPLWQTEITIARPSWIGDIAVQLIDRIVTKLERIRTFEREFQPVKIKIN